MCSVKTVIIKDIVDLHFEEASFLWSQRDAAATNPAYTLQDLAELDEGVESNIDGLRVAGDYSWELCKNGIDPDEPGSVFSASMMAFESGDTSRIDAIADVCSESRTAFRAAVSALGWLEDNHFKSTIVGLVSARSWHCRSLGIAACGIRRVNPRTYLDKAINSSNQSLRAVAFKAAGQLKRQDLLPVLQDSFRHDLPAIRFEAARSAMLLGDHSALDTLSVFALSPSQYTMPALQIALRLVDRSVALEWLKEQSKDPQQRRLMLMCAGVVGNSAFIPMLIRQMTNPELARAAGSAFSTITGVELSAAGLEVERPEGFEESANDGPDDGDEELGWPDADLVAGWWEQNARVFPPGNRFLAGRPITPDHCLQVLRTGNQGIRRAAALELALSQHDAMYFNTSEPANRQKVKLGL